MPVLDCLLDYEAARVGWKNTHNLFGVKTMSKEHKSIKADKKKPAMSPKEKKAAKKAKKATKKSTADL